MRIWLIVGLVVIAVTVSACDRNRINLVVTEPQPYAALESEPERVTFNLTGFGIYVPLPPDYAAEFAGASIDGQMFEGAHVPDVDVTLSSAAIHNVR